MVAAKIIGKSQPKMPLGERHRCRSLEHLVAEYPCDPQAKIPSLVAEIADFLSPPRSVPKWAAACSGGFCLLLVFTACLAALACERTQCTVSAWPRSGLAAPRPRRHRAAGQFRCVAQDLRIEIMHRRRPLLRFVWASGRSAAPTRHPDPCGGCWEWIGAAGSDKECRYDRKFHYYPLGTRIQTVLPKLGHPVVGQIEEIPTPQTPSIAHKSNQKEVTEIV